MSLGTCLLPRLLRVRPTIATRLLTTPTASIRALTTTRPNLAAYKSPEAAKARYRSGPFSWKAGLLFLISGGLLIQYFRFERARLERKRIAEQTKGVGRPKEVDQETYKGVVQKQVGNVITPLFITCDPARTYDQIKNVCKAYRVYFSTPSVIKPGQDYLVDHSIYFYLMGTPRWDFVEALGRQHSPQAAAELITGHIKDWKKPMKDDIELYATVPAANVVTTTREYAPAK
ncbi:hypothetical protein BGX38DRAFT_1231958 [Terfezia claveryi]|nr:hypothetical protein BGX38DRAFT_1231958 [Terfezia claveryi]